MMSAGAQPLTSFGSGPHPRVLLSWWPGDTLDTVINGPASEILASSITQSKPALCHGF